MSPPSSVYAWALGAEAARLSPEVREYALGADPVTRAAGAGSGVFAVAGSKHRALSRVLRPVVGPSLLLDRHEADVPFTVVNQPGVDGRGRPTLSAIRMFRFRGATRFFVDTLSAGPRPGTLRNRVGARGLVEIRLRCTVGPGGSLRLDGEQSALRLGRLRLPLPHLLGVDIAVEDGWDASTGERTVSVLGTNRLLGTVIEYRGRFSYAWG